MERLEAELDDTKSAADRLRRENEGITKKHEKLVQVMEEDAKWAKAQSDKRVQAVTDQLDDSQRRLSNKSAELEHSRLEVEEISKQLLEASANTATEDRVYVSKESFDYFF